jgi:hypothetical protein
LNISAQILAKAALQMEGQMMESQMESQKQ